MSGWREDGGLLGLARKRAEGGAKIGILRLADVTDGSERRLLQRVVSTGDILDKDAHQVGPFTTRQLDSGNGNNQCGGGISSASIG